MNYSLKIRKEVLQAFTLNWKFFLIWGLVLIILGALAIYFTTASTLLSVVLIGILLFVAGIVVIMDSFQFWWGKWKGFTLHFLMGLIYFIAGILLFSGPIAGAISLTLFLGIFFLVIGTIRIIYSVAVRFPEWGWNLFGGILSLILGILILAEWPQSSLFVLGLFIGIDLIVLGWTYAMIAISAKAMQEQARK